MEDRTAIFDENGRKSAVFLRPTTFKTGSKGYRMWGKVTVAGKRCQLVGSAIIIGSRPKNLKED